jgi:hypothetical protein
MCSESVTQSQVHGSLSGRALHNLPAIGACSSLVSRGYPLEHAHLTSTASTITANNNRVLFATFYSAHTTSNYPLKTTLFYGFFISLVISERLSQDAEQFGLIISVLEGVGCLVSREVRFTVRNMSSRKKVLLKVRGLTLRPHGAKAYALNLGDYPW